MDRREFMTTGVSLTMATVAAISGAEVEADAAQAAPPRGRASLRPSWVETTHAANFAARQVPALVPLPSGFFDFDAVIQLDQPAQTIAGFGGAFSEKGWDALSALPAKLRESALEALFGDGGCGFNLCRTPIGADDFSRGWYSYDEQDGDFALDHFSIANDRTTLVPYIKAAQSVRPDLRLWASPWSPPSWMKRNHHYAMRAAWPKQPSNGLSPAQYGREGEDWFIQEDRYFDAYARYFGKYVDAYQALGIPIGTVMPQNEFNSLQPYPSCAWTPEGLGRFLPRLGAEMQKRAVDIFFGTLERGDVGMVTRAMAQPDVAQFVRGVGVQWAGKGALADLQRQLPDLTIWGTEHECGVGTNDWHYARYGWSLIKQYFKAGAAAWDYWNMVLPVGGMSSWGWPQNSLIVVDPSMGAFRTTPDYWLMRHLSAFVERGARMIPVFSGVGFEDQLAFVNRDGSIILIANNGLGISQRVRYAIGKHMLEVTLAPDSLNTIVVPQEMLS